MNDPEAKHAATLEVGDEMVFVRELKEQPPEGYNYVSNTASKAVFSLPIIPGIRNSRIWSTKLRYPVGTELAGKESCLYDLDEGYVYLADDLEENCAHVYWSAEDAPSDSTRSRFEVVSNRVGQLKTIVRSSNPEIKLMGFDTGCLDCNIQAVKKYIPSRYGPGAWEKQAEIITVRKTK